MSGLPIREPVSEELLQEMLSVFNRTLNDYKEHRCCSTIAMLLVHLYELSLVAFTLKYSTGCATYSIVKMHLPEQQSCNEFVRFRDDVVHNLYNISNFHSRLSDFLQRFTLDNFQCICEECGVDNSLYNELLEFAYSQGIYKSNVFIG